MVENHSSKLAAIIAAGEDRIARSTSLVDTWTREGNLDANLGSPSKWINKREHFGWLNRGRAYLIERFGDRSPEVQGWNELTDDAFQIDSALAHPSNPYLPYLTGYRTAVEHLRGLPEPTEPSSLEKRDRDFKGSLNFALRKYGHVATASAAALLVLGFLVLNGKDIFETLQIVGSFFKDDRPNPPSVTAKSQKASQSWASVRTNVALHSVRKGTINLIVSNGKNQSVTIVSATLKAERVKMSEVYSLSGVSPSPLILSGASEIVSFNLASGNRESLRALALEGFGNGEFHNPTAEMVNVELTAHLTEASGSKHFEKIALQTADAFRLMAGVSDECIDAASANEVFKQVGFIIVKDCVVDYAAVSKRRASSVRNEALAD